MYKTAKYCQNKNLSKSQKMEEDDSLCNMCGLCLGSSKILKLHINMVHNGGPKNLDENATEYKCPYCGERFEQKPWRNKHIQNYHKRYSALENNVFLKPIKETSEKEKPPDSSDAESDIEILEVNENAIQVIPNKEVEKFVKENNDIICDKESENLPDSNCLGDNVEILKANENATCENQVLLNQEVEKSTKENNVLEQSTNSSSSDSDIEIIELKNQVITNQQKEDSELVRKQKRKSLDNLEIFYKTENKQNKFKCNLCQTAFNIGSEFKSHMKESHESEGCETCGKIFQNLDSFQIHHNLEHGNFKKDENSTKKYKCVICPYSCANSLELRTHIKSYHELETCDKCEKIFHNEDALRTHRKLVHYSEFFFCGRCDKWFKSKMALEIHKTKVHIGIKCSYCSKLLKSNVLPYHEKKCKEKFERKSRKAKSTRASEKNVSEEGTCDD